MNYAFHMQPSNELCVSILGHRVFEANQLLRNGLYGPLNNGNMLSFGTDV